jgi:hypothetical protein
MTLASNPPWLNPHQAHQQYLQDRWRQAEIEHLLCYQPKYYLYELVGAVKWEDQYVRLARVRFGRKRFEFDKSGRWAFVAAVYDGPDLIDFAAFAVGDDRLRAPYVSDLTAVGLDEAAFDANRDPARAFDLHYSPIAWILDSCRGALPVSWQKMTTYLLQHDFTPRGVFEEDRDRAEEALHRHLRLRQMRCRPGGSQ